MAQGRITFAMLEVQIALRSSARYMLDCVLLAASRGLTLPDLKMPPKRPTSA